MPSISTMLYPIPGYVRVEVNWADVTQATSVRVERVDCETGARTPLRPYVSFDGDYLTLSCGYAIFWDTEPPLDRCVFYCTTAQDASGNVATTAAEPFVFDDFNRVNVDTWNTATSGQTWVLSAAAADYDVNGSKGTQAQPSIAVRNSTITVAETITEAYVETGVSQVATGGTAFNALALGTDSNNLYMARVQFRTDSTARLEIVKRVAAVQTTLASATTVGTYVANTMYSVRIEVYPGSTIRAKAWPTVDPEPEAWTHTVTDSSLTSLSSILLRSQSDVTNTNVGLLFLWDNVSAGDVCADTQVIEVCSDDLVVPSSGNFRFGDPVRPCNDVTLQLTGEIDPDCVPTQGIFFGNMSADEVYAANTGNMLPTNAVHPIVVSRNRRDVASTLTVATRTFMDRDALRALNAPGSPLFLRGPAQYGIYDRYMSIADVSEHRPVSDHRVQPRSVAMPHLAVARPSGPSQGVCGTRVDDLCDIYPTWNALIAAGFTWADLLRGKASNETPLPVSEEITWAEVNATFLDWNEVVVNNDNWTDLLDGTG